VKVILIKCICMWPGIIPKSFDKDFHLKSLGKSNLHPKRPIYIYIYILTQLHIVHSYKFNPLNAELNPICHLLALLGAHPILHISRIRVNKPQRTPIAMLFATLRSTNFKVLLIFEPDGTEWFALCIQWFCRWKREFAKWLDRRWVRHQDHDRVLNPGCPAHKLSNLIMLHVYHIFSLQSIQIHNVLF